LLVRLLDGHLLQHVAGEASAPCLGSAAPFGPFPEVEDVAIGAALGERAG
jgi:hypothetical protein